MLENLNNEKCIYFRKLIIEIILETDMARHFDALGKFRSRALGLS